LQSIIDAIDLERAFPNIPRSLSPRFCFNNVRAAASENDKQRKLKDFRRRLIFRKSQTRLFSSPIDDSPSPPPPDLPSDIEETTDPQPPHSSPHSSLTHSLNYRQEIRELKANIQKLTEKILIIVDTRR
jgi:hypothetical protein